MTKLYSLSAQRVLTGVRFTAVSEGKSHVQLFPVPEGTENSFGLITALVLDDEKGIRANHALNRGETVALGRHSTEDLTELLGFDLLVE